MKQKMKTRCEMVGDLSPDTLQRLDDISNISFNRADTTSSYVGMFPKDDTLVTILHDKQQVIWGLGLSQVYTYPADPYYISPNQVNIHSISIHPEKQGHGYCKVLVKDIVKYTLKKFQGYPMYLNVRVGKDNPNVGGIKCYQGCGFTFADVPPIEKPDGPNFFMVYQPNRSKRSKRSKRVKRSKRS